MHTHTHTYAILEISRAAYAEIKESLEKAGYQHHFDKDNDGRPVIDMAGLAVAEELVPKPRTIFVNSIETPYTDSEITYEQLVALAYPDKPFRDDWTATYRSKLPGGGELHGILWKGQRILAYDRTRFSVVYTGNA